MQAIYRDVLDDAKHLSKTERIVVHLVLDKGYQLYTDNYYTLSTCIVTLMHTELVVVERSVPTALLLR